MALGIELSPDEEEDDQVFEWPKVPKSVRNAPPSPAMQSLLETLLGELEEVGQTHEEVYDTIVREELSQAILRAFVLSQDEYSLPKKFAMNSAKGNRAVRAALDRYIKAAKREAVKLGLDTPPKRSAAFEDVTVETDEGQTFDSFFGASE